jgi:hypothetical protein
VNFLTDCEQIGVGDIVIRPLKSEISNIARLNKSVHKVAHLIDHTEVPRLEGSTNEASRRCCVIETVHVHAVKEGVCQLGVA